MAMVLSRKEGGRRGKLARLEFFLVLALLEPKYDTAGPAQPSKFW